MYVKGCSLSNIAAWLYQDTSQEQIILSIATENVRVFFAFLSRILSGQRLALSPANITRFNNRERLIRACRNLYKNPKNDG